MAITLNHNRTGPFFDKGRAEVKVASEQMVAEMLKEGQAKVESQLYTGHGVATGEYKQSIGTQLRSSLHGVIDDSDNFKLAIRGKWLEGVASINEQSRFKGYRMWRKSTAHLRKIIRQIAGKHYARMAQRLT